ncbi:hypothetical protein PENTCL1PPCAC_1808 [Pristionchus entomophagus]|uniref:Integrator complex subunit 2 n=1 Tax=Pristionchus entomophagus TaxID=358040 RepID=A0AAV5SG22_9BILA|nr:hypothetical protein PENTCL1PPCAC_1808 [Pristionchus entomophagus]
MATLQPLAEVFSALQEGSFLERLSDFSDDQIRPFLPSLFISTFISVDNLETCNELVLSRIVAFDDANRLQAIAAVPFHSFAQTLHASSLYNPMVNDQLFRVALEEDKVYQVAMRLIAPENEDDSNPEVLPFISEDLTDEAALIFSFVVQLCPSLCTARKLAFMAVAYNNAPMVIAKTIANNPELFYPVLHELCDAKLAKISEDSPRGRQRTYIFALLLSLCPGAGEYMISSLLETKSDAPLALKLAVEMLDDESLIALIPPEIINRSRPLAQLLHRSSARQRILSLYRRLAGMALAFLSDGTPIVDTESFIICLCTLYSSSSYKPSTEDAELLVSYLISSSTHFSHDCHLIVAVAIVMGIPTVNMSNAFTDRIVKWLASLRELCASGGNGRYTLSHTLLFICTCLTTKKTDQLVPFLANIIKMKVSVPPRQIAVLQSLIVEAGFTERELCVMCTRLPVTCSLSGDSADVSIPAYCVNELLQGNLFAKNGVEITSWMERQLSECSTPLHPLVPGLLDRLAIMSVADSVKTISTKFIEESFSGQLTGEDTFTRRIVCAFFLLSYRLHYDTATATDRVTQRVLLYPDSMYTSIPLRYLQGVVEHLDSSYSSIRGWLTRLAAELFPYMQPSTESVEIVRMSLRENEKKRIDEIELERQMQGANPLIAVRRLETAGLSEQFRLLHLVARCTLLSLEKGASRECVTVTTRLWMKMESVVPRSLIEITAREWLRAGGCREIVPVEKLYEMPPLLFRVHPKLFSSPPHLECFLRALSFFTQAGRTILGKELTACPERDDFNVKERDTISSTNDHSQSATIVHALVEIIDPKRFAEKEGSLCVVRLDELTRLACEEIHQMFIADRQLLKLVLWQMLPLHLLPSLVDSIPSLHIALELINEMLATPDLERRLFAVAVTAQISHKYRIIQSAKTMELVVDVLHTMIRHCPTHIHLSLMMRVVPWMEQTIEVFPQLAGDITHILMSASAIAKSRLALNPVVISTSTPMETKLIQSIDESITRAMKKVTV